MGAVWGVWSGSGRGSGGEVEVSNELWSWQPVWRLQSVAHALRCGCGCCVYCVRCKLTVSAVHMWVCVKATCEGQHSRITLFWHTFEVTAVESASLGVTRCFLVCDWLPQLLHWTSTCGSQISLFWHTFEVTAVESASLVVTRCFLVVIGCLSCCT